MTLLTKCSKTKKFSQLQKCLKLLKLHHMFKMTSVLTDTGPKPLSPLVNRRIHHTLLHIRPHLNKTLFQRVYIVYWLLVHPLLYVTPNLIINGVEIRTVRRPEVWRNEIWSGLTQVLQSGTSAMSRCAILLKHEHVTSHVVNCWHHML